MGLHWQDPEVVLSSAIALSRSLHVFAGAAIWEFISHLNFDWEVLSGRRAKRWTYLVYLVCRTFPVIEAGLILAAIDTMPPRNCQALLVTGFTFGGVSIHASMLIMLLRMLAMWDDMRIVRIIGWLLWAAPVPLTGMNLHSLRTAIDPTGSACITFNTHHFFAGWSSIFGAELAILLLTLVGLFRKRSRSESPGSLWKTLYRQGVTYIVLAVFAEVPVVTLLSLNLNDAMNLVFLYPSLLITSIGCARMYRSLAGAVADINASRQPATFSSMSHSRNSHLYRGSQPPRPESMITRPIDVALKRFGDTSPVLPKPLGISYVREQFVYQEGLDNEHDNGRIFPSLPWMAV